MLEVRNLFKRYGSFEAVKGISFSVRRGEVLGLIGENGAGKSTTLKILAGLIRPDGGEVRYFGKDFDEEMKRIIGYLPEIDALYDNMTVSEYLNLFADIYDVRADIDGLLERLNLPDKYISDLSKGMRRKVSIARTLLHDPEVLVYDEPTGGLDPTTSLSIAELLRELAERGKIIVFSAHNMYYVERIADKVVVMKGGKALYFGSLEELIGQNTIYKVEYTIDGRKESVKLFEVEELLDFAEKVRKQGGKIIEIEREVPRLENVYFSLIGRKEIKA
ncbi:MULTISPECIES: ABC transporter ATP-binding protein [Archaeoglobus]|uniref:ABC transporter, ATP-binding protein n=2 Tax=Archaeoglobus fulgidus TaxID=2234 RepID=O29241_ARCFU|nr:MULTISPECIES: ABC transporter ATP-binding protein [Archaeoglobus]AAB90222.1 ABC transporter, ATP-binding protein [Archaeoglobus fulgidus DSM 4304]AIG97900.1 ABC-type multidrug transport system, ATPase component [Archaeoglobus fulgidus DSM 8774]MDI3498447.1 type transport system ATP-binding protein [Archaeoglobus sp.]